MARDIDELKERFAHYSMNLLSMPALKIIGVETAIMSQAVKDLRATFLLLFLLTTADMLTAIVAAAKLNKVCSWGMRQSVLKLSIYMLLVFLGHITYMVAGIEWVESAFMGLIVSTEIVSLLENIELIKPGLLPRKLLGRFGITLKKAKRK